MEPVNPQRLATADRSRRPPSIRRLLGETAVGQPFERRLDVDVGRAHRPQYGDRVAVLGIVRVLVRQGVEMHQYRVEIGRRTEGADIQ